MYDEHTAMIVRGVLSLGRRMRAERKRGSASLATISILATLRRLGPIPAIQLATEERLQPQSLTRLIAGLESDGLISRSPNEIDRRQLIITVTQKGLLALDADIAARREWLEAAMSATLTDDERDVLLRASELMLRLANHDTDARPSNAREDRPEDRSAAGRR